MSSKTMPKSQSLIDEILRSDSFGSLKAERDIAVKTQALGWSSVHGFYFEDLTTGKNREIDVAAERYWKRKISKIEMRSSVQMLIEVKTMKGFHLFVSAKDEAEQQPLLQHILWLGDSNEKYLDLVAAIDEFDLSAAETNRVVKSLNHYAYPSGYMRRPMASVHVRPPVIPVFNAFRETNIGAEKNLDNSVFWKASESLRSAYESIKREWRLNALDSIKMHFEMARRRSKRWVDEAVYWTKSDFNFVKMIHPVVVTDAKIWCVHPTNTKEIGCARFAMQDSLHSAEWWCDVVNSSWIDHYLQGVSNHYDSWMFKSYPVGFDVEGSEELEVLQ